MTTDPAGGTVSATDMTVPEVELWPRRPRLVSVVCPVFNEAAGIAFFVEKLSEVLNELGLPFEGSAALPGL